MDLVLINPDPKGLNEATVLPPLGPAYIAAVAEEGGFECRIIDAHLLRFSNAEIVERIPGDAKAVGIYMNSFSYDAVRELAALIRRERAESLILVGGPFPSSAPETVLKEVLCDGVLRGEGEHSVRQILDNLKEGRPLFSEVPGVVYPGPEGDVVSVPARRIEDLDALPFPAFHLLPPLKFYKTRSRKKPVVAVSTSRGCYFQCSFCSKDVFRGSVTFRSARSVLAEIDYLVREFGVRQIDIVDDNFAADKKRLEEILSGLIERKYDLELNLQNGIRTENLNEVILRKMKEAGFSKLAFGVESADREVLSRHGKKLELERFEEIAGAAKRLGFIVYGFFIVGLPGETEESLSRTIELAKKIDFDAANICMAIPFPGTELYRMVRESGRFLIDTTKNIECGFYDGRVFFEYGDNREEDIRRRYRRIYREFYSFRKQLKILLGVRSLNEFVWLLNAGLFVFRGMLKALFRSRDA